MAALGTIIMLAGIAILGYTGWRHWSKKQEDVPHPVIVTIVGVVLLLVGGGMGAGGTTTPATTPSPSASTSQAEEATTATSEEAAPTASEEATPASPEEQAKQWASSAGMTDPKVTITDDNILVVGYTEEVLFGAHEIYKNFAGATADLLATVSSSDTDYAGVVTIATTTLTDDKGNQRPGHAASAYFTAENIAEINHETWANQVFSNPATFYNVANARVIAGVVMKDLKPEDTADLVVDTPGNFDSEEMATSEVVTRYVMPDLTNPPEGWADLK